MLALGKLAGGVRLYSIDLIGNGNIGSYAGSHMLARQPHYLARTRRGRAYYYCCEAESARRLRQVSCGGFCSQRPRASTLIFAND